MKKRKNLELSEGPSSERRQHSSFSRDVLTPQGAPVVARHRTRPPLTSIAVRRAILDDIAQKPEAVKLRSLRRRLTALDRALSDREAEMLDRLTTCINELSNIGSLDLTRPQIRSAAAGRLPFGEFKRREIAAASFVLRHLDPIKRQDVLGLAAILDPSASNTKIGGDENFVSRIRECAPLVVDLYRNWTQKLPNLNNSA